MKKKIFIFLTIILIIFIPTVLTEIYLRFVGLGNPVTYDDNFVYGYSPKPNQKKIRLNGSTITINDVGLRSTINWKNNKDKKKIVFFGDSVTYGGSYIDDKKLFSHLTCDKIKKDDYICGNAGVNAYGIFNIVFRSRYDERLNEDHLRIFLLVPDDFYRGLQDENTAHFYLNNNEFIFPAIFEALNFLSTKYNIRNFISKVSDNNNKKNQYDLINESIKVFNSEIDRLKSFNKKFFIFYSPSKIKNNLNDFIYNQIFKNIDYEITDLSAYLGNDMYKDSVHYNEKGHLKVSEIISKKILLDLK